MALYWTHLKSVTLSEYEYITANMFSLSIDSHTTLFVRISRGSGRQRITKLPKNSHQSKEIPHPALISRHSLYLSLSLMIKAIRHKHNTINNFSGGSRQTLHNNEDLWEHCCWSDSVGLVFSSERLYSAVAHWPLASGINIYTHLAEKLLLSKHHSFPIPDTHWIQNDKNIQQLTAGLMQCSQWTLADGRRNRAGLIYLYQYSIYLSLLTIFYIYIYIYLYGLKKNSFSCFQSHANKWKQHTLSLICNNIT